MGGDVTTKGGSAARRRAGRPDAPGTDTDTQTRAATRARAVAAVSTPTHPPAQKQPSGTLYTYA